MISRSVRTEDNWYAVGSGAQYALGALKVGATAQEAVEAAISFSVYSSGPLTDYGAIQVTFETYITLQDKLLSSNNFICASWV
jgi:ATP-dependent protease HslVU (ClpYQ) peptidase subunit